MEKCTIILNEKGIRYKISKVIFYGKNGGFGVLAPYHNAKVGHLIQYHLDAPTTRQEFIEFKVDKSLEYLASDRVKLSVHTDGFVQFSGENPGKILSGRDEKTGKPKGLGLFTSPLSNPINGPTISLQAWGLNEFEIAGPNKKDEYLMEFDESNYEYINTDRENWNSYQIDLFIFPPKFWDFTFENEKNEMILRYRHPMYRSKTLKSYTFKILPFIDENLRYLIAIMVSRQKINFKRSGFIINPPAESGDGFRKGMMAGYPAEVLGINSKITNTIDYKKNS